MERELINKIADEDKELQKIKKFLVGEGIPPEVRVVDTLATGILIILDQPFLGTKLTKEISKKLNVTTYVIRGHIWRAQEEYLNMRKYNTKGISLVYELAGKYKNEKKGRG